jgi:hypothetical protein
MIRIRSAALALVISAGLSGTALAAGQISQDALNADRQSCATACTGKGQSASFCSSYCDCTVKGIDDQMTLDEYRGLSEAASKKQPAPQPALDKLKAITNTCRSQMGKPAD